MFLPGNEKLLPFDQTDGLKWAPEDLSKKFGSSWVKCQVKANEPYHILKDMNGYAHIDQAWHNHTTTCMLSMKGKQFQVPWSHFFIIEDRPPQCITNWSNGAILLTYNPDRQWRRGIGHHNVFLHVTPTITLAHHHTEVQWCEDLIRCFFEPDLSTLDSAFTQFKENPKLHGRALSNKYWLIRSKTDDVVKLYRRKAFMGSFLGKRFFVNEPARIFREELVKELPILKEKYAFR